VYPRINLKSERRKQFQGHKHPWIFSGAIKNTEQPSGQLHGKLVSVYLEDTFLLHGYYNAQSQIALRALSWNKQEAVDHKFFERTIRQALTLRRAFVLNDQTSACRLIFAESDLLPGFIVDQYNHTLILQIHTLGAENLKQLFVQALVQVYTEIFGQVPESIMEISDVSARVHEGMDKTHQELLFGRKVDSETIVEHGVKFLVDFQNSQKTGFFLDQRENRLALNKYVRDRRVLNLFSFTGGFSAYAGLHNAASVDSVDISIPAISTAKHNLELNRVPCPHREIAEDCFKYLEKVEPGQYDLIVVDPPAFIKSRNNMREGLKGYISINAMALRALPEQGLLVSSSCSAALNDEDFLRMLNWAADSANCQLQILEKKSQPADHPLTPYFPEGNYLKFAIMRKIPL
jgi:23S rRNA (cytosine1962-C5)-methyltransferase